MPVHRPDAIAITDAFDFGDYTLNSSLGRYDGDMYRDMYRRAQQEPLNSNEVFRAGRCAGGVTTTIRTCIDSTARPVCPPCFCRAIRSRLATTST